MELIEECKVSWASQKHGKDNRSHYGREADVMCLPKKYQIFCPTVASLKPSTPPIGSVVTWD